MLRSGGDDVAAAFAVVLSDAKEGQVIRLGGPRSPNHLARSASHRGCYLRARLIDKGVGRIAERMAHRCRIAELSLGTQDLRHARGHARIERRGRGMVKIHRYYRCLHLERCADWPRLPCTALNIPRMMLSSLRSS
jgi:citrate lyase beta subunit